MKDFNLKTYLKEGKLYDGKQQLNENSPGFDTRKSGEALPTLASVKAAYEAKNGINEDIASLSDILDDLDDILKVWQNKEYSSDESRWKEYFQDIASIIKFHRTNVSESKNLTEGIITEGKKSELDQKLAEIDKAGAMTTLEAKIAAIEEAVNTKTQRITTVTEDADLSELVDKKRVKEMQKEIKLLEKQKAGLGKMLEKLNGKSKKKEIVDEDHQGYDDREDESLGMEDGPESDHSQSEKARREDRYGNWGSRDVENRGASL